MPHVSVKYIKKHRRDIYISIVD